MQFVKMHGIGNDYVYVNGFETRIEDPASMAIIVSDRHTGIGSDGLIILEPTTETIDADLRMRMYNADGSESEMCGNGIRCVCKMAHDDGICRAHPMRIETGAGVLSLEYSCDDAGRVERVRVDMGEPMLDPKVVPVTATDTTTQLADWIDADRDAWSASWTAGAGLTDEITCISTGNPHAVLYCDDVSRVDLAGLGAWFEHHPMCPARINLHIVSVSEAHEVTMRTWERGSGLTQACGTGACAVCVAGIVTGRTASPLLAHLPGGDLTLDWAGRGHHVFMTGTATEVFRGEWRGGTIQTTAGQEVPGAVE